MRFGDFLLLFSMFIFSFAWWRYNFHRFENAHKTVEKVKWFFVVVKIASGKWKKRGWFDVMFFQVSSRLRPSFLTRVASWVWHTRCSKISPCIFSIRLRTFWYEMGRKKIEKNSFQVDFSPFEVSIEIGFFFNLNWRRITIALICFWVGYANLIC